MNARRLLGALILFGVAGAASAQNTLALRRTARISPGAPLVVADIATVSGPDAESLARVVIAEDPAAQPRDARGWIEIELESVRARLKQELGLPAGMIAMSGSRCDVQIVAPAAAPARDTALTKPSGPAGAESLVSLTTVRGAIANELVRLLRAPASDLRLEFEAADAQTLDTSLTGRTVEIAAVGSSERMPFAVVLHEANGRSLRRTVRVGVLVRRQVATAGRTVERGSTLTPEDVSVDERWLRPGDPAVGPGAAIGSVARRRIGPGDLLTGQMIEPPIVVHKGDRVYVKVLLNNMVMRRIAVATEDGAGGQSIEFAAVSDSRQRFRATVVERGEAVVGPSEPGTLVASDSATAQ
ncbi:MAG: flagellar basal body P-ring formation protein FlgA [Phycisphaerales bacterium]|nr:flagellar basal body P-ring formation protein FlgA [Phycisphaerales bacterium]